MANCQHNAAQVVRTIGKTLAELNTERRDAEAGRALREVFNGFPSITAWQAGLDAYDEATKERDDER